MSPMVRIREIEAELTRVGVTREEKETLKSERENLYLQVEGELAARDAVVNAVSSVEMAAGPDASQISRINGAMDPFMGARIEPGWHYVRVTEHAVGSGLPSNKLRFSRMGYEIAPCDDPETRSGWDENKSWTMRIPQSVYDARVAASREEHRGKRKASREVGSGMVVTQDAESKKSMADVLNG